MGVTRRVSHFEDQSLQIWFIIAAIGAALIAAGIALPDATWSATSSATSCVTRPATPGTAARWNGPPSPPPAYNFAFTPVVHEIDAWWDMKKHGYKRPLTGFQPIHMPANTGAGVVIRACRWCSALR